MVTQNDKQTTHDGYDFTRNEVNCEGGAAPP